MLARLATGLRRGPGADVFAEPDVFARPDAPARAAAREPVASAVDPARIMASVGEVAYEWSIDTDELAWGPNAAEVLMVRGLGAISSGRDYAKLLGPDAATSRFDAVMKSSQRDEGSGVPYQVQYALHPAGADKVLWIEDTGRWFAGADGKPARAHGVVRVINERHAEEERLAYLSRFDGLTGEMNRFHLTEVLETTLKQAVSQRTSCGFMLVAIDNLARINESYGFDVADEAIGAVAKRLRAKMRGGDQLGRFSGNKFAVILNNCTPDDMEKAAERLVAGVRDDVVRTAAGPVAVTVTIGGVTAPRHAATVHEILARAQETLDRAKAKRPGSFQVYRPNIEREALRRENVRAADEIVTALNERRILLAFEPVVETISRQTGVLRMPDAHPARRRHAGAGERGDPGRRAARAGAPARSPRAGTAGQRDGGGSEPACERQRVAGFHHRSRLVVDARRAAARPSRRGGAAHRRDHRDRR